jgi:hypothetical protein
VLRPFCSFPGRVAFIKFSIKHVKVDLIVPHILLVLCIYIFFFLVAPTIGSLLPLLEHRAELPQFLDQGQSVGPLGWVISSSQTSTCTQTQKNAHT